MSKRVSTSRWVYVKVCKLYNLYHYHLGKFKNIDENDKWLNRFFERILCSRGLYPGTKWHSKRFRYNDLLIDQIWVGFLHGYVHTHKDMSEIELLSTFITVEPYLCSINKQDESGEWNNDKLNALHYGFHLAYFIKIIG